LFFFLFFAYPPANFNHAPVGIPLYPGEYSFPWETIIMATFLAIIPVLIITALFQKQIIGGLTAGSDK